ncbi:MAG: GreA/GreB family elongation factor [Myxococcota bacterium]|nr:GreA/GreB family elongation factor [Myxococcota bacterium]
MSKAFTKEDADVPEPPVRRRGVPLPQDVPNYITAEGERALRAELANLAAGADDRAHEISEHLATAIVIGAPEDKSRVAFGATVTVEDEAGKRTKYRLVGAIEAAPREGAIYWQSPIAEALHDTQVGDSVTLPKGEGEIVAIDY